MDDDSITRLLFSLVLGPFGLFFAYVGFWNRRDLLSHNGREPKIVRIFGWKFSRVFYVVIGVVMLYAALRQLWVVAW